MSKKKTHKSYILKPTPEEQLAEIYAKSILEHETEWIEKINNYILQKRELIEKFCAAQFYFSFYDDDIGGVQHYKNVYNPGDYDYSGELHKDGIIKDLSQPIFQILEEEYNGEWTPTYTSRMGRRWNTMMEDYESYYRDITTHLVQNFLIENYKDFSNKEINTAIAQNIFINIVDELLFSSYYDFCIIATGPWGEKEMKLPFGDFLKLGKENIEYIYKYCKENKIEDYFCKCYEKYMLI